MRILVAGGVIVNEGKQFKGSLIIEGDHIEELTEGSICPDGSFDKTVDASESFVLPGVIDSHVHFREPGFTDKADIETETRAAAYGGVTSFFDMPNTNPQTTGSEALENKFSLAPTHSRINYSFFPGATNSNERFLHCLDGTRIPGIKLFMGSSTGDMLVNEQDALERIFKLAAEKRLVLMAHCEDTEIINRNMAHCKEMLSTDDPDIRYHPVIRSEEACYSSSALAAALAKKHHTRLHIAHISAKRELVLLKDNVTGEVCVPHLLFDDNDYDKFGALIKCNPSIKSATDKAALRNAVKKGIVKTISTDHAPHLLHEKRGGAARAMSGMPTIQFSLPAMLTMSEENNIAITRIAELMCHNQARIFSVEKRGFLRKGYKADITIVKRGQWTVTNDCIQSKCKWSPLEGRKLKWKVTHTICNGHLLYAEEMFDAAYRGEEITFKRP